MSRGRDGLGPKCPVTILGSSPGFTSLYLCCTLLLGFSDQIVCGGRVF